MTPDAALNDMIHRTSFEIGIGEDADDLDHRIPPEERFRLAMGIQ
jgi:hypothetical protein